MKDAGGNIKVQANPNGATVTGVITATSFSGDGSGLIGVASTDNIVTDTVARFNNTTRIAGLELAGITTGLNVSGVATFASNLDVSGEIRGPAEFIIDPAAVGDNTGAVRIKGDLYVDGENFIVDSETIRLADHVVGIASTSTNDLLTDGAGIGIGTDKFFTFDNTNTAFKSTENLNLESGHTYKINGTDVLSNDTLGSGVVNSALTSVGNLNKLEVGSISLNSGIVTATTFEGSGANLTNLTGASANTYGSDASVPILTVDANGRITGIGTTAIVTSDNVTTRTTTSQTATEGQTTFNVNYDINYIDVYLNGSKLESSEFVANNGSTVVLNTGAVVNDVLEFVAYTNIGAVNVSNTIRRTTKFTATSGQTTFAVTYDVGYVDVFQNGVKLDESEFTANDGVSVVLTTGAITSDILEFVTYTGVGLITSSLTTRATTSYTATSGQTTFAVNYVVGYVDVFQNGVKLDSTEFTATNGTSVVLTTGAVVDDIIEFIAYASIGVTSITVNDDTSPSLGGNLDLNSNDITGTGNINIAGSILMGSSVPGNADADNINVAGADNVGMTFRGSTSGTGNIYFADGTSSDDLKRGQIVYDHSNNSMRFHTNATEKVRITSAGNLGIGTDNPSGKLQVGSSGGSHVIISENLGVDINDGAINLYQATSNANAVPFLISTDVGGIEIEKLRVTAGGFVGIGTNIPNEELHIHASGTSYIRFTDEASGTGSSDGAIFGLDHPHLYAWNYEAGDFVVATNAAEKLRVTSGGNVNINGTPPWTVTGGNYRNLSISGEGASASGFLWLGNGAATSNADFDLGRVNFVNGTNIVAQITGTTQTSANDDGRISFFTKSTGSNLTERLRVRSDGHVASGGSLVASANYGDVEYFYNNKEGCGLYRNNAYANCGAHIEVGTDATDGWASVYLNRYWSSGEDERMIDFRISNTTVGNITSTTSGTTYNTTSDIRLKTDINPISDATDKLMNMNPVTHKWKEDPDGDTVHGFIAQEMQNIAPEAVHGEPDGEMMMGMDYGRITPIIVAALQNAIKEINTLKKRISELEN